MVLGAIGIKEDQRRAVIKEERLSKDTRTCPDAFSRDAAGTSRIYNNEI